MQVGPGRAIQEKCGQRAGEEDEESGKPVPGLPVRLRQQLLAGQSLAHPESAEQSCPRRRQADPKPFSPRNPETYCADQERDEGDRGRQLDEVERLLHLPLVRVVDVAPRDLGVARHELDPGPLPAPLVHGQDEEGQQEANRRCEEGRGERRAWPGADGPDSRAHE